MQGLNLGKLAIIEFDIEPHLFIFSSWPSAFSRTPPPPLLNIVVHLLLCSVHLLSPTLSLSFHTLPHPRLNPKPLVLLNHSIQAVADTVRTTLGPRGMDKLVYDGKRVTISNDGATIMRLLDVVHPAAKTLVDISMSQVSGRLNECFLAVPSRK